MVNLWDIKLIPNGFHYIEINCFLKKFSEFSNFKVSVLFCLIVTKFHYELVNNHFVVELQVILFIFQFYLTLF